jgi:hypothetical protein
MMDEKEHVPAASRFVRTGRAACAFFNDPERWPTPRLCDDETRAEERAACRMQPTPVNFGSRRADKQRSWLAGNRRLG